MAKKVTKKEFIDIVLKRLENVSDERFLLPFRAYCMLYKAIKFIKQVRGAGLDLKEAKERLKNMDPVDFRLSLWNHILEDRWKGVYKRDDYIAFGILTPIIPSQSQPSSTTTTTTTTTTNTTAPPSTPTSHEKPAIPGALPAATIQVDVPTPPYTEQESEPGNYDEEPSPPKPEKRKKRDKAKQKGSTIDAPRKPEDTQEEAPAKKKGRLKKRAKVADVPTAPLPHDAPHDAQSSQADVGSAVSESSSVPKNSQAEVDRAVSDSSDEDFDGESDEESDQSDGDSEASSSQSSNESESEPQNARNSSPEDGHFVPELSDNQLYDHQIKCVDFMLPLLEDPKFRGGVIADEMGLGKTVEALAIIVQYWQKHPEERKDPILILSPTDFIANQWQEACKSFTNFKPFTCTASDVIRTVKWRKECVIVLSTYSQIQGTTNNNKIYYKKNWAMVILDEGHRIKNEKAQVNSNVHLLKSKCRLVLTGSTTNGNLVTTVNGFATKLAVWSQPPPEATLTVDGTPLQNRLKDWESICAWLSHKDELKGFKELTNWQRTPSKHGDVEIPYPFMIRRLLKNYKEEVEKFRKDNRVILELTSGEGKLQDVLLLLAGKVSSLIENENTLSTRKLQFFKMELVIRLHQVTVHWFITASGLHKKFPNIITTQDLDCFTTAAEFADFLLIPNISNQLDATIKAWSLEKDKKGKKRKTFSENSDYKAYLLQVVATADIQKIERGSKYTWLVKRLVESQQARQLVFSNWYDTTNPIAH